jgi:hypothetical protein
LQKTTTAGGEVIDRPWGLKGEVLKVNDIDVGTHSRCQYATIGNSHDFCCGRGLQSHCLF